MFRRTTGVKPEDYYNVRLARGWTLGLAQELRILQMLIRLSHKSLISQLRRHWQATQPDLVVSLVPNFNRAMYQASRLGPAARALRDHTHGFRGFPAALLDRAPSGAAFDLRNAARASASARRRLRRCAYSRDLRHDHQSGFLPRLEPRSARRNAETAARSGSAHGHGDVRRPWIAGHARNRQAPR